jgi:hypothetical protein
MGKEYNIQQLVGGRVLPPMPPYPINKPVPITQAGDYEANSVQVQVGDKVEQTIFGTPQVMPIKIKLKSETDYWLFPVEPMISIGGENEIVKRKVAKKRTGGTIKEYWTQGDWSINIQGLLTRVQEDAYPVDDLKQLVKYCTAKEPLDVLCPGLEVLGILKIVIDSYQLPFTKGIENQSFSITASSDMDWELLIKRNTNVL